MWRNPIVQQHKQEPNSHAVKQVQNYLDKLSSGVKANLAERFITPLIHEWVYEAGPDLATSNHAAKQTEAKIACGNTTTKLLRQIVCWGEGQCGGMIHNSTP